jgi:hypothetical protein
MLELCYTSIAQGLDRGKTGFTTAGRSAAMSRLLAEQAERLSGFTALNQTNPMAYVSEPVNYSHLVWTLNTGKVHIVSRKGACPPDYTGRSNFLSHHSMLTPEEAKACRGGPAALAGYDGFLMHEWVGEARTLPPRPVPAIIDRSHTTAALSKADLETGWAEALADRLRDPAVKQTWLIYSLDMDILGIVADVLSQLEPAKRWQTTFATHVTRSFPGPGVECQLQCVVAGTDYAREIAARQAANTFDLTQRGPAPPRRPLANVVQPVAKASAASRSGPGGTSATPAGVRDRVPAGSTPREESPFSDILAYAQTAQRVPRPAGGVGFSWPWVAIPMAVATAMACFSALLGYQWFEANRKATQLMAEIRDGKDERKEDKKALKDEQARVEELSRQLTGLQKQLEEQQKQAEAAEQSPTETRQASGPTTNAPAQPARPEPELKPPGTPPAAMPTGGQAAANPGYLKPRDAGDSKSQTPTPVPEEPPRVSDGPRINPMLISDLGDALSQNRKASITLLTGLHEPPGSHAIEVLNDGAAKLLDAKIESKKELIVKVLGKQVAEIEHNPGSGSLTLEITKSAPSSQQTASYFFLLRYLTIRVQQTTSSPSLDIQLGKPINTKLSIMPLSQGDRDTEEKEKSKHFRPEWSYQLFGDDGSGKEASNQLGLLHKCEKLQSKKLVEHFEFADEVVVPRLGKKLQDPPPETIRFTLYTKGKSDLIGVQFKRKDDRPPTYQASGWYVPQLRPEVIDLKAYEKIESENSNLFRALSKDPKLGDKEREAKLKALQATITRDQQVWEEAYKSYPAERLRGRPVRLTLKPLGNDGEGSDGGIVVVDSLGDGPHASAETAGAGQ